MVDMVAIVTLGVVLLVKEYLHGRERKNLNDRLMAKNLSELKSWEAPRSVIPDKVKLPDEFINI